MPRLTIDQREVHVEPGQTILAAARKLGIDVPTMCFYEGRGPRAEGQGPGAMGQGPRVEGQGPRAEGQGPGAEGQGPCGLDSKLETRNSKPFCNPQASCMVCAVRLGNGRLVPSCATRAEEGMVVACESDDVRAARKAALELLLSDHVGDCTSPCERVCPAHMDIARMIRQIASGDLRDALITVKAEIALPAILGRICPAPCEKGCRRGEVDGPVAICQLKRYVAEIDLARGEPYVPACAAATGKRVAIVGAGPAGLAAAYALRQQGHAATVFDEHEEPGGALRYAVPAERLPRDVLDGEIDLIRRMGAEFRMRTRLGEQASLNELREQFDAVLVAVGDPSPQRGEGGGASRRVRGEPATAETSSPSPHPSPLPRGEREWEPGMPLKASAATFATAMPGVFAAGAVVRPGHWAIRSLAEGKGAAVAIDQFLRGLTVTGPFKAFASRVGKVTPEEAAAMLKGEGASEAGRVGPNGDDKALLPGFTAEQALAEAQRCLHCDCRKADDCKLRVHAQRYGADASHYAGERRPIELRVEHPFVIYEPGKCVRCGICVQIATAAQEPLGLSFVGRGFNVRVAVPFNEQLSEGLRKVAEECARACPTAALATREATKRRGEEATKRRSDEAT